MHFNSLIMIACLMAGESLVVAMGSFENLYFKLYPQIDNVEFIHGRLSTAQHILCAAVTHDKNGKGVYPPGKQKAFLDFLFKKKNLSIKENALVSSRAIDCAARTGNAEGVRLLLELGAKEVSKNSYAISLAVDAWLSQKQVKIDCFREKHIDQDYFSTVQCLLYHDFYPHRREEDLNVPPFKLAFIHQEKLPGLLDLLVLHADPTIIFSKFSVQELEILFTKYKEKKERISVLVQNSQSYFSLLIPDMQRLVVLYDFKDDNFLKMAEEEIKKANQVRFRPPLFDVAD